MPIGSLRLALGLVLAVVGLAVVLGAYLFGVHTARPLTENIAPAVAQSLPGGALMLARVAAASAPADLLREPMLQQSVLQHALPAASRVERAIRATVQPRAHLRVPVALQSEASVEACPPVSVDLALIRTPEGRRVIAASPDGELVAGLDVPLEAAAQAAEHPWSAGLSYGSDGSPGLYLERDLGRLRVGAEAIRGNPDPHIQARIRLGWSW
jgi:hypothetical protein